MLSSLCRAACVALSLLLMTAFTPIASASALPFLQTKNAKVVNEKGEQVTLRGCNLGNWLLIEAWMLGWDIEDQETIFRVLGERFGTDEANRLMTLYRDGYITPRDFDQIKSFGFNVVRLPFDSRMLIDAQGSLRPDAFKYLDKGLAMAEAAGVYVILDMHGVPGGQSKQDHTGLRDQNKLWTDATLQKQMVDLWKTIAERYKDRSVVAAYDVMNEPYGDYQQDVRPALREILPKCYEAIRSTGDRHMVIFPNALGAGVTFYGDLKSKGFTQIAFTDHYYAGLFGSPSTVRSHAGMFDRAIPESQDFIETNDAAMLIGEFNVVLEQAGGDAMMRRYFDDFAKRGWMVTMWSYKLLKPAAGVQADNWYLVTNTDALPAIDLRTSSKADIEAYFSALATMPLAADTKLRDALTSPTPPKIFLPKLDPLPASAPAGRKSGQWSLVDVDAPVASGVESADNTVAITAAGRDIFGSRDSFSFLQQPVGERAVLVGIVESLLDSDQWAKAGLMIRFGDPKSADYASAPFAMVNTFTDGSVALVHRDRAGIIAKESKRVLAPLPCRMAIVRNSAEVEGFVEAGKGKWLSLGSIEISDAATARIGFATCSHRDKALTRAVFRDFALTSTGTLPGQIVQSASPLIDITGKSITKDGAFDSIETGKSQWNRWGDQIKRAEPGGVSLGAGTGLWQEFKVTPGKSYSFAIRVRRVGPSAGDIAASIESTLDGKQLALADRSVSLKSIEGDDGWTVIRTDAVAASDSLRVLIRVTGDGANAIVEQAAVWQNEK